jgi:hypothetical protein
MELDRGPISVEQLLALLAALHDEVLACSKQSTAAVSSDGTDNNAGATSD